MLAFVCTAGAGTDTTLYLDNIDVTCASGTATIDPSAGPGQLVTGTGISGAAGIIDAASVYRGQEQLTGAARYWNVSIALADGAASCSLHTQGTASPAPLDGLTTAADAVYPYVDWTVPLTDAGGATTCGSHPLGGTGAAAGVSIDYTTSGPVTFDHAHPSDLPPFAASLVNAWTGDYDALDSVGASDGAFEGTANYAAGYACGAFSLDGAADVAAATPPAVTDTVSVEAWVYRADAAPGSLEAIAGRWGNTASGTGSYLLDLRSGANGMYPELEISRTGSDYALVADSTVTVPNFTWTYIAGTYDGQTARLYVNGALVASQPFAGTLASPAAAPFVIGAVGDSPVRNYFPGLIDEVRVYSAPLSDAEILANYQAGQARAGACAPVSDADLVAYWPADGDAVDAVGTNDGTPIGNLSYASSPWCQAWSFPTSPATYISLGDAPALGLTSQITVSAWIDFQSEGPAVASDQYISILSNWDNYLTGTAGYSLALAPIDATTFHPTFSLTTDGSNPIGASTTSAIPVGVWTHLVAVYDGAEVVLYVDGVRVGSTPHTGSLYDPAGVIVAINAIVRSGTAYHSMVGQIDEVRVYDVGMTASDVAALHASEVGGRPCP